MSKEVEVKLEEFEEYADWLRSAVRITTEGDLETPDLQKKLEFINAIGELVKEDDSKDMKKARICQALLKIKAPVKVGIRRYFGCSRKEGDFCILTELFVCPWKKELDTHIRSKYRDDMNMTPKTATVYGIGFEGRL